MNDCGFAGGFGCHGCLSRPERRGTGFMLLVHKFSLNGARMSRRPPFRALTHPRYRHPSPRRRDFLRFSAADSLSFFCFVLVVVESDPPLCEITRLFTRMSPGARVTREEISKFIGRSQPHPTGSVLHRRLVPTFSRKRHGTATGGADVL